MKVAYDRAALLAEATRRYTLGDPLHGPEHWLAVEQTALELCAELGGDEELCSVFALLHDSCRRSNGWDDSEHGPKAAALAQELNGKYFYLPNARLKKLVDALYWHDAGLVSQDLDTSICWSADRLQLLRCGITPELEFFCEKTWPIIERIVRERGAPLIVAENPAHRTMMLVTPNCCRQAALRPKSLMQESGISYLAQKAGSMT